MTEPCSRRFFAFIVSWMNYSRSYSSILLPLPFLRLAEAIIYAKLPGGAVSIIDSTSIAVIDPSARHYVHFSPSLGG